MKQRLDDRLVADGLAVNKSRAQALIMAGVVLVNDKPATKAGQAIPDSATVRLKEPPHPWVSRGGVKLEAALKHFSIPVAGCIAADIGASTGGFTDVLLHYNAKKVYAIDVGHNQLAWKLRIDPRVVVMEKCNARHLSRHDIPDTPHIVVCDASFISLKTVLPAILALSAPEAHLLALIKPQFEAGREHVGKGGIIRDSTIHEAVCADITAWLNQCPEWQTIGIIDSPITGHDGNREFLLYGLRTPAG